MTMRLSFSILLFAITSGLAAAETNDLGQETYDIDSSWAIKSSNLSSTFGDKQSLYDDFINKCHKASPDNKWNCDDEGGRIRMNVNQPMSMRNYTKLGFKKIRAPDHIIKLLDEFWEQNKDEQVVEWGDQINVYHNLWEAPSTVASVQNSSLPGTGDGQLRDDIWDSAKEVLEAWTGQYLSHCSIWGIRTYHNNSILTPHVDRNPLVSSAIINVAQDVDEPWPLEVWGHDGKPYNITMEPGDMVLYESHSVIHGRPFPMRGRSYSNIFVHYEPIGSKTESGEIYLDEEARESREAGLPPYVIPGSPWDMQWKKSNPNGWELYFPIDPVDAARSGDLEKLRITAAMDKNKLFKGDGNGWQPIHEAAAEGHVEVVNFLIAQGADVDARTEGGHGESPLKIALNFHAKDHPMISLLRGLGGHEIAAEETNSLGQLTYDIDSSWAIKSANLSSTFGDKQSLYDDFIDKCLKANPDNKWNCNDDFRIRMNVNQPMSMRNYTKLGFKKIRAPDHVIKLLNDFWAENKDEQVTEWSSHNVYHNLWDAPSTVASVQNSSLPGTKGGTLRDDIWDSAKEVLEAWTGQFLAHCSIWGIRTYHNNSILTPHVDRNPLVSSAIINVAQDVDEPWPLEVWGHDGKPYNITMEPGDMVLYESHSVIHGRPFPMRGRSYSNIFVHYEPIGSKSESGEIYLDDEARESREAGLPPYVIPGSPWDKDWKDSHPNGWELYTPIDPLAAAKKGNVEKLRIMAAMDKNKLFEGDGNGWQPIHEAARAGHVETVNFLIAQGANKDARTHEGKGMSPLKIALEYQAKDHPVVSLLRGMGAHEIAYMQTDEL